MAVSERELARREQTQSERFMNKIVAEFGVGTGEVALTAFQKRLAQNYFIALDGVLHTAEEKRLKKSGKYQDAVPVTWANVNMERLALDVVAAARVGLDPAQPNHINLVPYKNNTTGKYDIGFIDGYRGIELKAMKYGIDVPDHVIVEVVYSTDKFRSIRRDRNNPHDAYEFEVTNDFNRGSIVGGFYYHIFLKTPEKNKLVVMSIKEIEKRKPDYASVEFWGGEKDKWENGQKVGKEQVEGWYEKMVYKTIHRAAYKDITIDSQKIDNDYMQLKQSELSMAEQEVAREIHENGNRQVIDIETGEVSDDEQPESPVTTEQDGQNSPSSGPSKGPGF